MNQQPVIEVELLEAEDPEFAGGSVHTASALMTNPTSTDWDYTMEMYLGVSKAATSGLVGPVTIPAGGSAQGSFTVAMPTIEGVYPVYLDIWSEGELLKHYRASEDVVITVSPQIEVGPITWT